MNIRHTCSNMIPLIGICLCIGLGLHLVEGRQPGPRPGESQEYPRSTILSSMASELTSVYGNCSFPPNDVLTNNPTDSYDFLERCDSRIPHLDRPISDEGVITCLGLFEVGLRLCSLDEKYFKNDVLLTIPKDARNFNTLLDDMNKKQIPSLCTDLTKVLELLGEHEFSVLNKWNLLNIFQEAEGSCTRICFDYKNNARLMCKLILWGSNLLMQSEPKSFEFTIGSGAQALQSSKSHTGLDQTKKAIPTPSTLGLEMSAISQGFQDDDGQQLGLGSNRENTDVAVGHEETDTGARLESSSATMSSATHQAAKDTEERHNTQDMPVLMSSEDKPTEMSSKSAIKEIPTKLIPSRENQTPGDLVSEEIAQITDRLNMESSRPSTLKQIHDVLVEGATKSKSGSMTIPTSSIEGSKPQDGLDEGTQKSRPTPITKPKPTSSIEGSKPQDVAVGLDGNSVASPPEKTLPDISPRGDDFRDHYDSSMDQNPDLLDDDVNFPPVEPELPSVNQEPTGYKTDYKSPREEFTNSNTFLQEQFEDAEDSHFFSYFIAMIVLCIVGYVVFHNKQKILALALEGRSRRGSRRRPTTANYHKLDNNLEEAVSSPCSTSVTHVIY